MRFRHSPVLILMRLAVFQLQSSCDATFPAVRGRAFAVAAPRVRNGLTNDVTSADPVFISATIRTFSLSAVLSWHYLLTLLMISPSLVLAVDVSLVPL